MNIDAIFGPAHLIVSILSLLMLTVWISIPIIALLAFRKRALPPSVEVIWTIMFICILLFDGRAFLLAKSEHASSE